MKASRPTFGRTRSMRSWRGTAGRGMASVAMSGTDRHAADGRDEAAGLVVERDVARIDVRRHATAGLERPAPAAALAGGDPALRARRPDRPDDVEVTATELGVDDVRREGPRPRRDH